MTRLIAVTCLLIHLFMAAPSAVGSVTPAGLASPAETASLVTELEATVTLDETAADESQEHGLSAEHTDWPVLPEHTAHSASCLRQAWSQQPALPLHSASAGPTPPPPRTRA